MNERDKRVGRLTKKVTIVLILLAIILTTSITIVCYVEFTNIVESMYHKEANQVGTIINSYIPDEFKKELVDYRNIRNYGTPEEISKFEIDFKNSSNYKFVEELMESFSNDMNMSQVFIYDFTQSDGTVGESFTSVIDVVNSSVKDTQPLLLGTQGDLGDSNKAILQKIYSSGNQVDDPLTYRAETSYSVVALIPIIYRRDRVIGVIGVEDPMTTLANVRGRFILLTTVIAVVLTTLIALGFVYYNRRYFLKPLYRIINETKNYINNPDNPRDSFDDLKTNDDLEILGESINTLEQAIDGYVDHIERVTKEQERVETELDIATQIQYGMLPSKFPYFPDRDEFEIYAYMLTAREVGGDFYDFYLIDDDHLGMVIADVSGKGIPAALFMALSKTLIKDYAHRAEDYREIFENVNNSLTEGNEGQLFVTALMAIYEISTGKIFFINAGHNPPLIMSQEGNYTYQKLPNDLVLAMMPGMPYQVTQMQLKPGQKLFIYTDGIVEAQTIDDEQYGEDRLKEILDKSKDLGPEETLRAVKEDVDKFVNKGPQFDDMTMLCFKVKKIPGLDEE